MNLSAAQVRVVGCLLEKELTTPDNYINDSRQFFVKASYLFRF